jgi:hypothetical protein
MMSSITSAQTTGFTYQGRLTDGGAPATGVYDLQFGLWDSQSSGTQIGSTQNVNGVQVTSGVFTVTLDFGANAFPGGNRFLEISARVSGAGSFTLLTPRQPITSTPYAVRSLRATTADSVSTSGVPAGSGNYIQNTSSPQSGNFNITGSATVGQTLSGNVVNAATQFNLGGARVLSGDPSIFNLFVGVDAGRNNNTGSGNSFFGFRAGETNTSGDSNSFFGSVAGLTNTTGSANSFFGRGAGILNTIGFSNSFFGKSAGANNLTGAENSFFGVSAGDQNTTGGGNSFFGSFAGTTNTSGRFNSFFGADAGAFNDGGSDNSFVGVQAGRANTSGNRNTVIGAYANLLPSGSNATAIGANAVVGASNATAIGAYAIVNLANSIVLGGISGINGATADTNVGIGTTAPQARLHVRANGGNILFGDSGCGAGSGAIGFGSSLAGCNNYALLGGDGNTYINSPPGGTIIFREGNGPNRLEIRPGGTIGIGVLDGGGGQALCRNGLAAISACSSSLRYKTEIKPYAGGLQLINRLQPVSFNWKTTHQPDIGLIAEEVATVEPRLTFTNQSGEIEGVNYSQLTAVLINAVKEQQKQIEKQQEQIVGLKKLVCRSHRRSEVCK